MILMLIFFQDANQDCIVKEEGIKLLIQALKTFSKSSSIQSSATASLRNLARNSETKQEILDLGAWKYVM